MTADRDRGTAYVDAPDGSDDSDDQATVRDILDELDVDPADLDTVEDLQAAVDLDISTDGEAIDPDDVDELDARALEQYLTVLEDQGRVRGADGQYLVVSESGSEHLVDARLESCECADYEYRGHKRPCKHLRRVAFATSAEPVPEAFGPADVAGELGEHVDGEPRWG